jgi:beta-N-acetylhexosaminidase
MIDLKAKPFYLDDEAIAWVNNTKESMTLDEKIGQLFVPVGYSGDPEVLDNTMLRLHVGGIMYRCGDAEEMQATHRYLQENSKIPLLIGANLEDGGIGIAVNGTAFGKQLQAAATDNPENGYRLGKISCSEGAAVGCNWAFAPVVDIDRNWRNPITNVRTYGNDPERVLAFGRQYMKAAKEENILVAIKHFPGDGCDEVDQHILTSVNDLSVGEWDASYGKIYKTLIDEGAQTVMVGHIAQPAYQNFFNPGHPKKLMPATLSPELLKNLLREKLGFNGLIVSDATPMVGFSCAMERSRAVPYAIESGCDMFLFNKVLEEDFEYMKKGYEEGILSEQRLDEALTRILATKASLGLHKKKPEEIVPGQSALSILRNEEHVRWAKECADKSVTLVKDTQNNLPISPEKTKKVLLEILGHCDSNERVLEDFRSRLAGEGFEVELYEKESFETAQFDVEVFKAKYDLVIYIANVENRSNQVTNRLDWYTFWGNGNNVPWFVEERPTIFISLANPYHLIDVPMIKTFINAYSNNGYVIEAVMDKIMGRSRFKGKSPVDPFCGKEYLRW